MQTIGGQAVIEGVMMKSDEKLAVSVRLKNGSIKTKKEKLKKKNKLFKLVFFRGIFVLIDTLVLGIKALMWSSNQQLDEGEKMTKKEIAYALFISIGAAIILFMAIPFFFTNLFVSQGIVFNLVEGVVRIAILVLYVLVISRMDDVKTLFQYHGAEHKAVHCYEAGERLTVANAKKYTTLHHRCGTAFLLIVLIISVIVFSFIPKLNWTARLGLRIVLIPLIASLSYEILRLSARFKGNFFMKTVSWPGLLFQRLTTKEPTDRQIEVAIKSLEAVK